MQRNRGRGFYDSSSVDDSISRNIEVGTENQQEERIYTESGKRTLECVITAYCHCAKCCGKTDGITASGDKATEGVTIAMDKSMPFGTKIYIDGVGERIVQDRGGAIKGNRIDLYFDSHQEALNFGRQTKQVTILN